MELNWTLATLAACAMLASMFGTKRRADTRAWAAWRVALGDARHALASWLRIQTRAQLALLGPTLDVAREHQTSARSADAVRVLGAADTLAAHHLAWLRRCLTRWGDVARAQGVAWRVPPPSSEPHELRLLRCLARAERLGNRVLPWGPWRLHLRRTALTILGIAFAVATLRARRTGSAEPALDHLRRAQTDLTTLDRQVSESFEHLLRVLPERRPDVHA